MKLRRQLVVLLAPLLALQVGLVGGAGSEDALPSPSPVYCGNWQENYTRLHRAILSGEAPQRYVVALGDSGLADTLVGGVSAFYYALLSGRAFLWDHFKETRNSSFPPGERVPLEWAYDQPHINWTNIFPDARPRPRDVVLPWNATDDGSGVLRLRMLNTYDNLGIEEFWEKKNLSTMGENFSRVEINTNKGTTYQLFKNPHHAKQLFDMGLRPDTAFGCVINYLLDLNKESRARLASVEAQLNNTRKLKIGIQIRTGDRTMLDEDAAKMQVFSAYFECAEEVEESRRDAYPDGVMWYLVTDSVSLRAKARERYGDKLIEEPPDLDVGHVVLQNDGSSVKGIVQTSAAENWLFAMTDVQIITRKSGFGRTAAFRSMRFHSMYTIDGRVENIDERIAFSVVRRTRKNTAKLDKLPVTSAASHPKRKCGPSHADELWKASQTWSRIRM